MAYRRAECSTVKSVSLHVTPQQNKIKKKLPGIQMSLSLYTLPANAETTEEKESHILLEIVSIKKILHPRIAGYNITKHKNSVGPCMVACL